MKLCEAGNWEVRRFPKKLVQSHDNRITKTSFSQTIESEVVKNRDPVMFSSQVTDVESSAESKNVFTFQFQGGSPSKTTDTALGPFLQVLKISIRAILTTSQGTSRTVLNN